MMHMRLRLTSSSQGRWRDGLPNSGPLLRLVRSYCQLSPPNSVPSSTRRAILAVANHRIAYSRDLDHPEGLSATHFSIVIMVGL